jgi:ABC-type uncharacterized transport system permease subunit
MDQEIIGIALSEWIGYAASAVVLLSFFMKKMRSLRTVNTIGCSLFIAYGFALDISWPIVVTNVAIVLVNLYYLITTKSTAEV